MAAEIPTTEPTFIAAGDTAKWKRTLGDYPAGEGWALSYAFQKEGGGLPITISSSASSDDHLVNLTPAVTQLWASGRYFGNGYVSKSSTGERYLIWEGPLEVGENFAASQQIDPRTRAKRILDFIDASFEKVSGKQVVYATVDGVQLQFRSFEDLIEARNYWATIVAAEEARQANRPRGAILARFSQPA